MRRRWWRILGLRSALPRLRAVARTFDCSVAHAATVDRTVAVSISKPITVTVSKFIADADQLRHSAIVRVAFTLARPATTRALRRHSRTNRAGPSRARVSELSVRRNALHGLGADRHHQSKGDWPSRL
jgi:hypothetical protein